MKKIIISILYITCLIPQLRAQETLSLKQCREMALTHNKRNGSFFPTDGECTLHDEKL